jgi:hypothetical protein
MMLVCLGTVLASHASVLQENRTAEDPKPIFRLGVAPCNHSVVPVQHFTTDAHGVPQTEEIYVGGLPCLPDHCHVHDPSEGMNECVGPGKPGCCLSRGAWSDQYNANLAVIAACGKGDPGQLWSKSGGSVTSSDGPQLCLDGPNLCLTHRPGEPVLVGPRSNPYLPGQDWKVTAHSVLYPGKLLSPVSNVTSAQDCRARCAAHSACEAIHYDEAKSTCDLHETSMCLTAMPL